MQKLILASGSQYRQSQLHGLGLPFISLPSHVDESPHPNESPYQTASRLAIYKAKVVAEQHPDAWVIGCDQTGDLGGVVLGKSECHERAVKQLSSMSGQKVLFHSAIALVCPEGQWQKVVSTEVHVRHLSETEIERYLRLDTPYDCAGSFKIERAGSLLMSAIHSDDPSALIGLPLIALGELLRNSGFNPLA